MSLVDVEQRQHAIEPTRSFIVQAPAGSGKTELLTQRLLGLLATVERYPEEVLAITFTKKAAAEMRHRIIESLLVAETKPQPLEEPAATNWRLAKSVLIRDQQETWGILNNPHRLRIQTIDGLCSSIGRQMPITAGLGASPQIKDDCYEAYHEAAKATLVAAYQSMDWTEAVEVLLAHMDNDLNRLEGLLTALLVRREQWLPHIMPYCNDAMILRDHLEQALVLIIEDILRQAVDYLECAASKESALFDRVHALAKYAAEQLGEKATDQTSSIMNCMELDECLNEFLGAEVSTLPQWRGIVELFTAKDKTRTRRWRKASGRGVTARIGFPAGKECQKQKNQMIGLLEELNDQHTPLLSILEQIALLPPPIYEEGQWQVVEALLQVLPIAVAQLNMVFQREGFVDYSEVSQSALYALGSTDDPSELALKLDYQIRHVLVDEFQDTSLSQFSLLEKLTAGWQPGDGRTLFIVGDPMQSIYRFREADVSLFLRARRYGVGDIALESLILQSNFRSNKSIVHWVNDVFQTVFPPQENLTTGAVTYSTSIAARAEEPIPEAVFYGIAFDASMQAGQLADYVQQQRAAYPGESIALLVRAKTHVLPIAEILRERDIPYQAVEIENLGHTPFIQDLLSLTKAMNHLGDRIAWLSLLRGPFCGLDLVDLLVLSSSPEELTVWDNLVKQTAQHPKTLMSDQGLQRIQRLVAVLSLALANRGRGYLRDWIESTWIALGGLLFVDDAQLEDAEQFFVLLEQLDDGGVIGDIVLLERKITNLFARTQPVGENPVQIMTIHKSKGLEFDTVVLPALEKKGRADDSPLLAWCRQDIANDDWLLLAPIKESGSVSEPIYQYVRHLESEKAKWELVRLFYVATTRAKKRLGLFVTVGCDEASGELKSAATGSLQQFVGGAIQTKAQALIDDQVLDIVQQSRGTEETDHHQRSLVQTQMGQRLVLGVPYSKLFDVGGCGRAFNAVLYQARTEDKVDAKPSDQITNDTDSSSSDANNEMQRILGIFVHQLLEQLSYQQIESTDWLTSTVELRWLKQLQRMGLTSEQTRLALPIAKKAIHHWCVHHKLRSLRKNSRLKSCEYEISSLHQGKIKKVILDSLIVDEFGCRWIVDYKIVSEEEKINSAIANYRPQLENYARLVSSMNDSKDPIKCVLYFPATDYWHEWDYVG